MVFIYAIQLEKEKYYIGKTDNPEFRLQKHFNSDGSEWTKKYKPLRVIDLKANCDDYDEDKITIQYMVKYGINNVRGGSFVSIKLEQDIINTLKKMINGSNNNCFICGKNDHFSKDCQVNKSYNNSSNEEEYKVKKEDILFKQEFIKMCKKIDKNNSNILTCEEIIKILKSLDSETFNKIKQTNIYYICQTINRSDLDYSLAIQDYRKGIIYEIFIEGLLYVIKNDTEECNYCEPFIICKCRNSFKKKITCYRCGREGHFSNNCYASKHIRGFLL